VEFVEDGGEQSVRRVGGRAAAGGHRDKGQEVAVVERVQDEPCTRLAVPSVVALMPVRVGRSQGPLAEAHAAPRGVRRDNRRYDRHRVNSGTTGWVVLPLLQLFTPYLSTRAT
jgi:hypothetical protein